MAGIVENKWLTKSTLSPRLASMTAATVMAAMSSPTSPPRYRHSSWSSRPLTPGSVMHGFTEIGIYQTEKLAVLINNVDRIQYLKFFFPDSIFLRD
jgi:hypothetical protein